MAITAIYARKSTESEDRQVLSIDSQVKELTDYANRQGWRVGRVFKESKTAKSPGRLIFSDVLKRIDSGEIDTILCWKLDRLARNPVDGGAVIWAMEQKKLVRIATPQRDFVNTGNDKFWMQLEFGMAKKYVDDLSDNVKRGLRAKVEQGWQPGVAPLGYLNDKSTKQIVIDPVRFPLLRRMWDLMLTGDYSPPDILERATRDWGLRTRTFHKIGGGPMARSAVYDMFQNSFYYGVFHFGGQLYKGAHEPLVTKSEFDTVQRILATKGRPRPKGLTFNYRGLMRCGECGASVTAENRHKRLKNGRTQHYIYYHCTKRRPGVHCSQRLLEEKELETQVFDFLRSIQIDKDYAEWANSVIDSMEVDEQNRQEAVSKSLTGRLAACRKELSELTNVRVRGLIEDNEFSAKRAELQRELLGLEHRIENLGNLESEANHRTRQTFDFAATAMDRFQNGDHEARRTILSQVGSNRTLLDRKLLITAQKPFEVIRTFNATSARNISMFEPTKFRLDSTRTTPFESGSCAMLRVIDDVRTAIRQELLQGRV